MKDNFFFFFRMLVFTFPKAHHLGPKKLGLPPKVESFPLSKFLRLVLRY